MLKDGERFFFRSVMLSGSTTQLNAETAEIDLFFKGTVTMFKRKGDKPFHFNILGMDSSHTIARWTPNGAAAGRIEWIQGNDVLAVTLIRSGRDSSADERVLSDFISDFISGKGFPQPIIDMIQEELVPSVLTVYHDTDRACNSEICAAALGFGKAFFSRLDFRNGSIGVD
jgi:hypothetical protein